MGSPFPLEIFGATQFYTEILKCQRTRNAPKTILTLTLVPKIVVQPRAQLKSAKASGGADALNDGSGEPSWSLGNMKFAKVRQFKGKTYIDIREYYVDKSTMETKPGKKGISMNVEQYCKLKEILSEIDDNLG